MVFKEHKPGADDDGNDGSDVFFLYVKDTNRSKTIKVILVFCVVRACFHIYLLFLVLVLRKF